MSSTSVTSSGQPSKETWISMAVPPIAASGAIIPVFRLMMQKTAQQQGKPLPYIPFRIGIKEGLKASPTVGAIVGSQMVIQSIIERVIIGESQAKNFSSTLASSAIVGTVSAPVLAIFNGKTMGWTFRESLNKLSMKQVRVIAAQETACVGGLSLADLLATAMKKRVGDSKALDYTAALVAGAAGGLAGHPANTALTLWQSGMSVHSCRQLMQGSTRRALALGLFSVLYTGGKQALNSSLPTA